MDELQMKAKQLEEFLEKDRQRKLKQNLRFKKWREAHPEVFRERNIQYKKKYADKKKNPEN